MTQEFAIGQWVRSLPYGTAATFYAVVINRIGDIYVVRDAMNRRFERKSYELEALR
jgi:hypothetical protein